MINKDMEAQFIILGIAILAFGITVHLIKKWYDQDLPGRR